MRKPSIFATLPAVVLVLPVSLATVTHITPSFAQTGTTAPAGPSIETKAAARASYSAGETAYQAGDYTTARTKFEEANRLIPSIHAQFWIAMTLAQSGKITEGYEALKAVLDDPNVSKLGAEKTDTARAKLAELEKAPATVEVSSTPSGAVVSIGGKEHGKTPATIEVAAGTHQMVLSLDGHEPKTADISVKPGEKAAQNVTLKTAATPPPAAEPAAAPEAVPEPEKKERSLVPAYVTLGVAGASAVVGTIFGIMALGSKSDYDATPTEALADDAERNALISDMAFGVTITLGITGVVLLTAGDDSELAAKRLTAPQAGRLNFTPYVSPQGGGAAARMRF